MLHSLKRLIRHVDSNLLIVFIILAYLFSPLHAVAEQQAEDSVDVRLLPFSVKSYDGNVYNTGIRIIFDEPSTAFFTIEEPDSEWLIKTKQGVLLYPLSDFSDDVFLRVQITDYNRLIRQDRHF